MSVFVVDVERKELQFLMYRPIGVAQEIRLHDVHVVAIQECYKICSWFSEENPIFKESKIHI